MPELPEVETVRRGLEPVLTGAVIERVEMRRPDLRFPFPENLPAALCGARIEGAERRAKYLLFPLSTGMALMAHLGMTGRFRVTGGEGRAFEPGVFYAPDPPPGHDHLVMGLRLADGSRRELIYSDPRRFGFVDLVGRDGKGTHASLPPMGPEPLGEDFDAAALTAALRGKKTPLKAALLDQRNVAGLGNIYVCEALFRAGLSPRRMAGSVGPVRAGRLVAAIKDVLREAIEAGGASLRDYAGADGKRGGFQQRFDVYDREGEPCTRCGHPVLRFVQAGRSTFSCSTCQR
ncbi:MAG: bifunctional DNA-formamidopyrimidine glycosylase/DNA-(apurinic or apyrimidinic site) lyase [Parvularcula sp.]|jgi:formamidopyrimidine-DNA glycosylase|nr:bifunctional DNA-formamidopyrimidine glycosylase/DNA-(apurinic or apyrimidinic site) lyase [Parvularcula sp.]